MIPALSDPDGAGFFDDLLPRCADLCYDSGMKACLSNKIGHLLALLCTVVWGVTFVASKRLLSFYTPAQLMFMRFVIAYAALWVLFPKWERPTLREELHYLLMGITGCSLYFWTENTALTITYAGNVSTIVALAPILTAIGAHFFTEGREKLNRWVWIGFGIAMLGVVLVVFNGAFVLRLRPAGDLLALLTAATWAVYSVLQERILRKRSSLFITRKVMFYGIVSALPLMLAGGFSGFSLRPILSSGLNIALILFLGLVGSALCYLAWCTAEGKLGVVTTTNYVYAVPFVTMAASAVFLGEPISLAGVLGAVFIVAGVWVSSRKEEKIPAGTEGGTAHG